MATPILALCSGRQQSDQAAGQANAESIVHVGGGALEGYKLNYHRIHLAYTYTEDVEGGEDDQSQKEGVVVEN